VVPIVKSLKIIVYPTLARMAFALVKQALISVIVQNQVLRVNTVKMTLMNALAILVFVTMESAKIATEDTPVYAQLATLVLIVIEKSMSA
jgi:hypothetical protein